ncbi:TPA: hypothetical protein U1W09_000003 [Streptococcus suis]|nr:hypothetical protein [Streptococcus suis]HEM4065490.1 hypothetical protein [Streptococcus suis]
MPEFYTTDDFTTPTECLSEALGSIQNLYEENRIEDKEKAEQLIDSYKYAIELLKKAEAEL